MGNLTNMKLFIIAALLASVYAEPESEAKADAKPWVTYGSALGYAGYPHVATYAGAVGYPYASAYGLGYNGYALGTHYLGKRSADGEAEAKPDAYYGYSAYGYPGYRSAYGLGYGLGYGYRTGYGLGYGYGGYAYGK